MPNDSEAVDYKPCHKKDVERAMRECMAKAAESQSIFDYRRVPLPKTLLRKSFASGGVINLPNGETMTIVRELGRGAYGVVVLCSDALKIQAPIGSLAHEYSTLLKIEDRVKTVNADFHPFPLSRALYAFEEGGLFSMSAGSDSGMTLIDVANCYKQITGNVPEIVAMYYTARMLRHLETLHQAARVLVSSS